MSERDRQAQRLRYRDDPDYRAKALERNRETRRRYLADPDARRVMYLRAELYRTRDSREAHLRAAEQREAKMVRLGVELVKALAKWKKRKRL